MTTAQSEDEDEYDELPSIVVNSSGRDSSRFAMPCAGELAAARARERRAERALAELAAGAPRSDSSGSEGEAALAGAARALRLRGPARAPAPRLAARLPAAAAALPPPARALLLQYARAADAAPAAADRLARRTLRELESWAGAGAEPAEWSALAAWACLALCSAERAALGAGRAARAAHAVLAAAPPGHDPRSLAPALLSAVRSPRARAALADALRGGGARARALAGRLARAALRDLLGLPPAPGEGDDEEESGAAAARWRRLAPAQQLAALQLAARAGGGAGGGVLAALAGAPPPARAHAPDALKVLVTAAKLQVLFPAKSERREKGGV